MNVLALQGGGVLGYGQSLILSQLEASASLSSSCMFDMIGGTSVGSIIGAPLSIGISANKIEQFFTQDAGVIFSSNVFSTIGSAFGPKYSATQLEESLKSMLGFATLKDCKTKFVATSFDCVSGLPVYFKSYVTSSRDEDGIIIGYDNPIELWQICRASSAAQTYFSAYEIDDMILIDGGNAGDNAPDVLLAVEALQYESLNNIKMLSLGTGNSKWDFNANAMVSPSPIRAGLSTIKIVFSAGVSGDVWKAAQLFGNNHYRLSPDLGDGIAIDDAVAAVAQIPATITTLLNANPTVLSQFWNNPLQSKKKKFKK